MDIVTETTSRLPIVDNRIFNDLPPHILRLARMLARDCSAPGKYIIHLTISDRPREPAIIQTARMDVIRDTTAKRK